MIIDDIKWRHPCGCGDTAHLRAEFEYSGGWLRVKKTDDGYSVTKFGHDKQLVSGPHEMTDAEFGELIA